MDPDAADDVMGNVFFRLVQRRKRLDPGEAYFGTAGLNEALHVLDRSRRAFAFRIAHRPDFQGFHRRNRRPDASANEHRRSAGKRYAEVEDGKDVAIWAQPSTKEAQ